MIYKNFPWDLPVVTMRKPRSIVIVLVPLDPQVMLHMRPLRLLCRPALLAWQHLYPNLLHMCHTALQKLQVPLPQARQTTVPTRIRGEELNHQTEAVKRTSTVHGQFQIH